MARSLHKTCGAVLRDVIELAAFDLAEIGRVAHAAANLNGRILPASIGVTSRCLTCMSTFEDKMSKVEK